MVNSRCDELSFLVSILTDLKMNYEEHDNKTLEEIIEIVRYRLDKEFENVKHRGKGRKAKDN